LIRNRRKTYQEPTTQPSGSDLKNLKPIGVSIPFNSENGIFNQTYTNTAQVIENLRNLFRTQKGERIMQPEFGTDIQYFLFEPIIDEDQFRENIMGEVRSALNRWMPYVAIQSAEIITDPKNDARFAESRYAVIITINLYVSGTNIFMPVTLGITESGNLDIT
jgi:phage baseplate assembly protein W